MWSGVAELACAVGLVLPATRRAAGRASAGLLVAVFPANLQMAADAVAASGRAGGADPRRLAAAAATLARLPLQWLMIRSAWTAGRPVT